MRWLIIYFGIIKFSYSSQHPKDLLLIPSLNNAEYTKPEKSKKKASGSLGLRGTGISLTVINVLRSAPWWEAKRSWDQSIYARQKAFSWATGIEWLSCNCLALTMHQATCKMVEVNRRSRINKKNEPKSYDSARFLCISYKFLVRMTRLERAPLPPQRNKKRTKSHNIV